MVFGAEQVQQFDDAGVGGQAHLRHQDSHQGRGPRNQKDHADGNQTKPGGEFEQTGQILLLGSGTAR